MAGDCFTAAVMGAAALAEQGVDRRDVLVAHGLPLGQGPENGGYRFWHAWMEVKQAGGPWVVVDLSNGLRVVKKRTAYYRLGRIDPEAVHRYTLDQAADEVERVGTVGPWVDGWETMEDEPMQALGLDHGTGPADPDETRAFADLLRAAGR